MSYAARVPANRREIEPAQALGLRAPQARLAADKRTERDILKETLSTLQEADDIGTATCHTLNAQTEQIEKIQNDADEVSGHLDRSKWLLRGMSRWGWVQNLFGGAPPPTAPTPQT